MLRVELGPKEVAERSCILARCHTAGARSPRCRRLLPPLLLPLPLHAQMRAMQAWGPCRVGRHSKLCLLTRPALLILTPTAAAPAAAGEVAEKQVVAVGQQLCDKVKQQLEDMGQVLELAADSGAAAAKAAEAAAAAAEALEAEHAAGAGQQQQEGQREQQRGEQQVGGGGEAAAAAQGQGAQKQSADDVDGDFAGMPLLQVGVGMLLG